MRPLIKTLSIALLCGMLSCPAIEARGRNDNQQQPQRTQQQHQQRGNQQHGNQQRQQQQQRPQQQRQQQQRQQQPQRQQQQVKQQQKQQKQQQQQIKQQQKQQQQHNFGNQNLQQVPGNARPGNGGSSPTISPINGGNHGGNNGNHGGNNQGGNIGNQRPGNGGWGNNGGNGGNNGGNVQPGNGGNNGNHGGNNQGWGNNGNHGGNNQGWGNNGNQRPGNMGPGNQHPGNQHPGNNGWHFGNSGPHPGHNIHFGRPPRPLLPPPVPYRRPIHPVGWVYRGGGPVISTILGITIGTALNITLNSLINRGYDVTGYGDDAIYVANAMQLNLLWPNATLYYGAGGGLIGSEFFYSTPYYDMERYNLAYNQLYRAYGAPVSNVPLSGGGVQTTWWGANGAYVQLTFNGGVAANGTNRFFTTLSFGN